MQSPSFLLRDVRNMKKNQMISQSMTSKDIGSIKDLKKARSSEQLINLNKFIDNKNDKIKTIDQKLEIHQNQIERNGAIIQQLTNTLTILKNQFNIQKEKVQSQQKKNKQLKQQIQRTNKLLKTKNLKIQQLVKKLEVAQKETQNLRPYQQKTQELTKTSNQLRKQLSKLQQNLSDKKGVLSEQNKQIDRYRDKINELGSLKVQHQKIKSQIKQKQNQIDRLSSQLRLSQRQNQSFRSKYDQNISHLTNQLRDVCEKLREKQQLLNCASSSQKSFRQKFQRLQIENKNLKSQVFGKQVFSQALKRQLKQLKQKFESLNLAINRRQEDERDQANKILSMKTKIQQLQKKCQAEHSQVSRLKPMGQKMQNLCKKSKRLDELYRSMIPQIQCPYGHELQNPVTVIPCGHNYCLNCKKGYTKQCLLCNGKLKIEAVYRNQLMDDIINIVNSIRQILEMIGQRK